jgi:hypothetical protein
VSDFSITLDGYAYSPINAYWGTLGPVEVNFNVSGGSQGIPGQILDATISDFRATLNHLPYIKMDDAVGDYYLSSNLSGLAIYGQNQIFEWQFSGPAWTGGIGNYTSESVGMNFNFSQAFISHPCESRLCDKGTVSASEPATFWLSLAAFAFAAWKIYHDSKFRRPG